MGKEPYTVGGHGTSVGETEKGYTRLMRENILGTERSIRRKKDEELHVFDSKGNFVKSFQGKGNKVQNIVDLPKNSIITHNHPRALGKKGVMAIGNSFSLDDIKTAIWHNAKEIRAVTTTYTFSIKRPAKGYWGVSPREVQQAFREIEREVTGDRQRYIAKRNYGNSQLDRATITHYHEINKRLAKRFGWSYTKKRG